MGNVSLDPRPLLAGASFVALLLLVPSCQAPADADATPAADAPSMSAGDTRSAIDPNTGSEPTSGAFAATAASTAPDLQDPQDIAGQRARVLVRQYVERANRLRNLGGDDNLGAARLELLKARDLDPDNEEVARLLRSIAAELQEPVGTAGTFAEEQARLQQVREQRSRAQVMGMLDNGERLLERGDYRRAIDEFRRANLMIDLGKFIDWGDLDERAAAALREAEAARDDAERTQAEEVQRAAAEQLRRAEATRSARRKARVDDFVEKAARAFRARQFQLAQDLAFEAMKIDGGNQVARNLHNAAIKAGRSSRSDRYYEEMAREIRRMQEESEDLRVPQMDILHVDGATWERANGRSQATSAALQRESPDDVALRERLRAETLSGLSFTEDDGTYDEVKTRIQTITAIPIIITPGARETIDGEGLVMVMDITSPISVENFLDQLTGRSENLAWTVRDGVVQITSKASAGGQNYLDQKDVRDLIFPKTQFLPPTIRDIPTGESDSETPRTGGEGEDKTFFVEMDTLIANIKDATDPNYWDAEGGGVIDQADAGYLLVTANPEMHRKVDQVLEDLRRFATTVVTIESKFLTISQNFLQEIGVDFRGLGGSGAKGSVAQLDDITNGLDDNSSRGLDNSGTQDPAGNPASGAFFNDGGDGDVRGRTENFFADSLGNALSTTGGATAALVYIDDLELQAIIQAVEKREDVQELNSQNLTVLNNERGHVAIINQTAYVRDFDVEVAQAAFIADPKIDVIQDGIVLDVRPTVNYDRKSITMELQPTVAELIRPIPTFSTSLAGTTQPVTVQLPQLTVRSFATTVKVPDGGSVLIGGLREVLAKERRAEVPFFAKIPLLSFFFKSEGVVDETSSLMVLVRASVTDVNDIMEGF